MALFKIFKGSSDNFKDSNNSVVNKTHAGYAYFTTDDGKFYIDICEDGQQLDPIIGNYFGEMIETENGELKPANRICINLYNNIIDCGTSIRE